MVDLMVLTAPDGQYLSVAPSQIVALRGKSGAPKGLIHAGVNCLVYTVDGKFLSVVEHCEDVAGKLRAHGIVPPGGR